MRADTEAIESIIERINSGDDTAFTELCDIYKPLIQSMSAKYADATAMSGASSITETQGISKDDLSQEATLALYRAAKTYRCGNGKVSFGLYAKICIRNALVSELRRVNRKKKADRVQGKEFHAGLKRQSVRSLASLGVTDVSSVAGSGLLSSYEKKVFAMYAGGMKIRDIATVVGRSSKSVSNAVFRIKAKLRLTVDGTQDDQ